MEITAYNPLPVTFTHGQGIWFYDEANEAYLDTFSGIAVCILGHAHPEVTKTIQQQAAKLIHTSNVFHIETQEKLAKRLTTMAKMDQVFFCNSGAEANEAAIKLARLYGHKKDIETPSIIVMSGAFHGRTMATLSASSGRKVQAGFEPLVPGFVRAPFNDIEAIRTIAQNREDIVAVLVEPVQGEGGVIVGDESYFRQLAQMCEEHDWLLMFDEVQTGNGRTGHLYACMGMGIQPDVLTTAKGLGNGFPIGACMMSKRAKDLFKPGNHGSTFGGNPLACATALTVLDVIEKEDVCRKVLEKSVYLKTLLAETFSGCSYVTQIRSKGFMFGLVLDRPCLDIRLMGLKHRILLNVTAEQVIRLLPALTMTESEMNEMVRRLKSTLEEYVGN